MMRILTAVLLAAVFPLTGSTQEKPAVPISLSIEGDVDAELAPVAGQMTALFYQCYPKLIARFSTPTKPAPKTIRLVFVKGLKVPGQCSGNKIEVSVDYLRKQPGDIALLTHELTHAVQQYPGGSGPGWITEGIADYARHVYGPEKQLNWSLPKTFSARDSYKDSYRTTGRFLLWLETRTPGSVDKIHLKMQDKTFKIDDFQAIAGRPVEALWEECVADLKGKK
jgi:hypothetical protein